MLNQTVTMFKSLRNTEPQETTTLLDVLKKIRDGKWKSRVEPCLTDLNKKNFLPCFTPAGRFSYRSIAGLEEYNGVICLDVDHIEDPVALKEKCKTIPWAAAAFITPSGKGLKVIVLTDGTCENFTATELKVAAAWLEATGTERDPRAKDIARIQFISYDPDIYMNENSETFKS